MSIKLYGSLILHLCRENQLDVIPKALQIIGKRHPFIRKLRIRPPRQTQVHKLIAAGELTQALNVLRQRKLHRLSELGLENHLSQRLEELKMAPPSNGMEKFTFSKKEMKVLFFLTNSFPFTNSGYSNRSHFVLSALGKEGIWVWGVTRLAYPLVIGKFTKETTQVIDGVTYRRLIPTKMPQSIEKRHNESIKLLNSLVRDREVSILHTTTNFSNAVIISRVARDNGIPWVYEVRGELERTWLSRIPIEEQDKAQSSEYFQKARKQETEYARAADAVIALSEISKRQLVNRGVEESKIHIIPNSIDSEVLNLSWDRESLRHKLGLPRDKKLVGSITSIVAYEGLEVLIDAIPLLPSEYVALIVGDGVARSDLEKRVATQGISSRVIFAGEQSPSGIEEWYAVLDFFVVPRRDTPVCRTVTPIKALKAQALGIPVIASDLPALREVTGGVETYIPAGDSRALASAIRRAVPHNEGRLWASSRTWERAAEQYKRVYRFVLQNGE